MYKTSERLDVPNDNTKIWRYMDFAKYIFLISEKKLHFTRLDQCEDKFEGSLTKKHIEYRENEIAALPEKIRKIKIEGGKLYLENLKKNIFINCWCVNDYESPALWKIYAKGGKGIVIQSTVKKLKESFNEDKLDYEFLSKIQYINYESESYDRDQLFKEACHKRKGFDYESELRVLIYRTLFINPATEEEEIMHFGHDEGISTSKDKSINRDNFFIDGFDAPIDLNKLIEKIYVFPKSPDWFYQLLKSVTKNYRLKKKVDRSELDKYPFF